MNNLTHALAFLAFFTVSGCSGQTDRVPSQANTRLANKQLVGGFCDGCKLMYVGMPKTINQVDTSPAWNENGQKLLIAGRVLKPDGRTPAANVIIYYYHTDNTGHYSKGKRKPEEQTLHGHIRGWVKSDRDGKYAIYTRRPAPYPDLSMPAHIHVMIKEPGMNEYYINEFVFDEDELLTSAKRKALENRGGSGILEVRTIGNMQMATHNIVLGLNIPNYPYSH